MVLSQTSVAQEYRAALDLLGGGGRSDAPGRFAAPGGGGVVPYRGAAPRQPQQAGYRPTPPSSRPFGPRVIGCHYGVLARRRAIATQAETKCRGSPAPRFSTRTGVAEDVAASGHAVVVGHPLGSRATNWWSVASLEYLRSMDRRPATDSLLVERHVCSPRRGCLVTRRQYRTQRRPPTRAAAAHFPQRLGPAGCRTPADEAGNSAMLSRIAATAVVTSLVVVSSGTNGEAISSTHAASATPISTRSPGPSARYADPRRIRSLHSGTAADWVMSA